VEKSDGANGKILSDIAEAPLAMGATSVGVSVREMSGAYTMFTRGGEFEKPYTFTEVYAADGELLLSHGNGAQRLISEESADIMTRMLKNVVLKGTAKGLALADKVEVAGKTGTSNSGADKWFIGYTPDYVCGVWSGYRDGRDIGEFNNNPACIVFDGIMAKVYSSLDGYTKKFSHSDGVIASSFCIDSGALPAKACHADLRGHRIETGYFKRGTEPRSHCDTHILAAYDKITHAIACDKCPDENIIKAGFIRVKRSFPCEVKITDSQFTYQYLPLGILPTLDENLPYFASINKKGEYSGSSGVTRPRNRYCREHYLETTATTAVTTAASTTERTTPSQTTETPKTTASAIKATTTMPKATTTIPKSTTSSKSTTASKTTVTAQTTIRPQTTAATKITASLPKTTTSASTQNINKS
jgi:membrane peptidoglycan carboxypeptidase